MSGTREALVVKSPFGGYAKGDLIEDPALVAAIRTADSRRFVSPLVLPAIPEIEPAPAQDAPPGDSAPQPAEH